MFKWDIPEEGAVRIRNRFAWLPVTLFKEHEHATHWVWLCRYTEVCEWKWPFSSTAPFRRWVVIHRYI